MGATDGRNCTMKEILDRFLIISIINLFLVRDEAMKGRVRKSMKAIYTHTHIHTSQRHRHTHTHTHTQTHTHAQTETHTRAHTHKNTHTHTHTHTHPRSCTD